MSLRRTALQRKTELRRASVLKRTPLARGRELAAKATRSGKSPRRRDTGPTPSQRNLVAERAGYCCELCGIRLHDGTTWSTEHSFHHRQARGAGGTSRPAANFPSNLLLVCGTGTTGCHGFIEANRTSAEGEGWLVRHGQDPADVVVTVYAGVLAGPDRFTRRVLLNDDGDYLEAA